MNRILNISLLLILQIVYFFAYTKFNRLDYIFITFWIVIVSANTYLLYNLFTTMKNYVKSKNILAEIFYFIACLLLGALITNGPTELILGVPLIQN